MTIQLVCKLLLQQYSSDCKCNLTGSTQAAPAMEVEASCATQQS